MINFGYSINNDRQIDYDGNDRRIAALVAEFEPSFRICISCGTCTATCSAGNFTDLNLRQMIVMLKRGQIKGIQAAAMKCMLCGKCHLACPRGVNTRNIILGILHAFELAEK